MTEEQRSRPTKGSYMEDQMWGKIYENSRRIDKIEANLEFMGKTVTQLSDGQQSLSTAMHEVTKTIIGVDKKLDVFRSQQTATAAAAKQASISTSKWVQWVVPLLLTLILAVVSYQEGRKVTTARSVDKSLHTEE